MATATTKKIKVENLGPIPKAEFTVDGYGVTVLTGPNGRGKSILLDSMAKAASGKGKIPLRDRTRHGSLEAFGAVISLGASTRRSGTLEVLTLEGKFDLATLVDPGMKDATAADKQRIKALVGLTGVTADAKLFKDRGEFGDFGDVVNPSSVETDDLCEMAARVKRDYEAMARSKEMEAERETNHAVACEARIEGVDFAVETTVEEAKAKHSAALSELTRLETSRENQDRHAASIATAKERLAEIKDGWEGPTVEQLNARVTEEAGVVTAKQELVRQLEDQLRAANEELKDAVNTLDATRREYERAQQHEKEIACLEETINADVAEAVTDTQLATAREAVATAEAAFDSARQMESAIRDREKAKAHRQSASDLKRTAEDLRDTAKATDEVLSDAIQCDKLRVVTEDGKIRLMADHPRRGETPYHELSAGEKWRIAIDLGADQVGKGGLLVIPQEAWEALDVYTRPEVHKHAIEREVYVLTAEATRDEADGEEIVAKHYAS